MKKIITSLAFLMLFTVNTFALYEDKDGYPYERGIVDFYVGGSIGTIVSHTLDDNNAPDYQALFFPSSTLGAGMFNLTFGVRAFDKYQNSILSNLRLETELLYLYKWRDIIQNSQKTSPSLDTSKWPSKGQEVLKNAFAVKMYYDFRHFSEIAYPYLMLGMGSGQFTYRFYDVSEGPNGLGEQYDGEKVLPFGTAALGFAYETKIIKSTVFLEYRVISSLGDIVLNTGNDGIEGGKVEDPEDEEIVLPPWWVGRDSTKTVSHLSHGLAFGFHFFLY